MDTVINIEGPEKVRRFLNSRATISFSRIILGSIVTTYTNIVTDVQYIDPIGSADSVETNPVAVEACRVVRC
jgi:hypothetical protein